MPTYEYECTKCAHCFEAFQSIKEKPLARCPACRGKLRRLIGTGSGVIFKGSGFYQTDYPSESYKKGKSGEGGAGEAVKSDKKESKAGKKSN